MSAGWVDPLYRPRTGYAPGGELHRFGPVDASVLVTDTDPGTVEASYQADRSVVLVVTDDVTPDALARALPEFREFATSIADRPTRASVTLPSRDVDRCRVARDGGFAASAAVAVAAPPAVTVSNIAVTVRDFDPKDAEAIGDLWCEQTDYEARVGTLRTGARIRAAIRGSVPLTVPGDGITLVAEVGGVVVGTVLTQSVAASSWATGRLTVGPAAYLSVASTTAGRRGAGVGRALVAELHARHRAAGVAASLLHYSVDNPLSVPFWHRCGYRPLLTIHSAPVAD